MANFFRKHKIFSIIISLLVLVILVYAGYWVYSKYFVSDKTKAYQPTIEVVDNVVIGKVTEINLKTDGNSVKIIDENEKVSEIFFDEASLIYQASATDGKFQQVDFSQIKVSQLVKAVTDKLSSDQEKIIAWDFYIINE